MTQQKFLIEEIGNFPYEEYSIQSDSYLKDKKIRLYEECNQVVLELLKEKELDELTKIELIELTGRAVSQLSEMGSYSLYFLEKSMYGGVDLYINANFVFIDRFMNKKTAELILKRMFQYEPLGNQLKVIKN